MAEKIVVLGAGESGVGAALLAKQKGFNVWVSDRGAIKDAYKAELNEHQIPFEEGKHTVEKIMDAKEVIKSPGIPERVPLIQELIKNGIPVISEIEFAGRYASGFIIGITGSNGKTTTTKLTYHLLKSAGLNVAVGGNIGQSFARNLTLGQSDYHVLELSSFQLDGIFDFRPHLSMILNITPDHLDRYEYNMELYIASKFRITRNQTAADVFLFNKDDSNIQSYLKIHETAVKQVPISINESDQGRLSVQGHTFDLSKSPLQGPHNRFNANCAIYTALNLGVAPSHIQEALVTFVNAPHRLELVATVDEVDYINDSKATNVDATLFALKAMQKPIIWVVGGQDKGNDYTVLMDLVKTKVKAIVCMGVDNQKLLDAFGSMGKPVLESGSAKDAVEQSNKLAEPGDVVLLSPACASFDLFKNYEDRGDQFKAAVRAL